MLPIEKTGACGKGEVCDAWTEQVCEPHLNNSHTHTKNLNTLSPTTHVQHFEFGVLKVLENTQMFYLVELNFIDLFHEFLCIKSQVVALRLGFGFVKSGVIYRFLLAVLERIYGFVYLVLS